MLPLNDDKWKELEGGYRMPYDASIPLKKLEEVKTNEEAAPIFKELWNELHHQGDVGLASYFAVPHLIRIAKQKNWIDWNVFALVGVIEIERHSENPQLPVEYEAAYLTAIRQELPQLASVALSQDWNETMVTAVLAALAASKGHISLANAIIKLEDQSSLEEFLENF